MISLRKLTWRSLANRRASVWLCIATVAISVMLLLAVERIRTQTKTSFTQAVSGTDLIVGARSGQLNLLLYSVFRLGDATNNLDWQSYKMLQNHPSVAWTIPISLGDSHRGYRVVGTSQSYFDHFRYGAKQSLRFAQGSGIDGLFDTVIGAEVAKKLGYQIGDRIVVAHGLADVSFSRHDTLPFVISGILAPTGTPVDHSVHVSLEAIEAIHVGWESGAKLGPTPSADALKAQQFEPKSITAVLVGLKSRLHAFRLQREINQYAPEALSAIMPGIALQQLWQMLALAETALLAVSMLVVVAGLLGMLATLLSGLRERRREMAILRAMGARPYHLVGLLVGEASLLTFAGCAFGTIGFYAAMSLAQWPIEQLIGVRLTLSLPSMMEWTILLLVFTLGTLIGLIPALSAYRQSLSDGMNIRI
ncbi:ABC transporter permease [Vibrio sp. SM6]|uniref:ABC transporter permease n=1 Tax=Vibrio agarilyticus TaxID=2726741 RepID=A0A7X8TPG9_9VIBR|nr:ABC transporter permease [Vibrio agarilyticus]NLS12426.1 ABC transporter permease [Vibrio agarilyticus]